MFDLSIYPFSSSLFIASLVTMVISCTAIHLTTLFTGSTHYPFSSVVSSMSMLTGVKNLFWAKSQSYEIIVFDVMKTGIILSGTIGHILVCAEMPISYYILGEYRCQGHN